jgi:hypothetical protein
MVTYVFYLFMENEALVASSHTVFMRHIGILSIGDQANKFFDQLFKDNESGAHVSPGGYPVKLLHTHIDRCGADIEEMLEARYQRRNSARSRSAPRGDEIGSTCTVLNFSHYHKKGQGGDDPPEGPHNDGSPDGEKTD